MQMFYLFPNYQPLSRPADCMSTCKPKAAALWNLIKPTLTKIFGEVKVVMLLVRSFCLTHSKPSGPWMRCGEKPQQPLFLISDWFVLSYLIIMLYPFILFIPLPFIRLYFFPLHFWHWLCCEEKVQPLFSSLDWFVLSHHDAVIPSIWDIFTAEPFGDYADIGVYYCSRIWHTLKTARYNLGLQEWFLAFGYLFIDITWGINLVSQGFQCNLDSWIKRIFNWKQNVQF